MERQRGRGRLALLALACLGWALPGAAPGNADLEVRLEPARRDARQGREVVSHIRVIDHGPGVATGVVVQVTLSDDFNPVRLVTPHGDCGPERCEITRLEPGERVGLKLVTVLCCVPPGVAREAWIRVEVRSSDPDPHAEDNESIATVVIRPRPEVRTSGSVRLDPGPAG